MDNKEVGKSGIKGQPTGKISESPGFSGALSGSPRCLTTYMRRSGVRWQKWRPIYNGNEVPFLVQSIPILAFIGGYGCAVKFRQ